MQFQQPCLFELSGLYATSNRIAEVSFLTFIGYYLGKSEIAECLTETCLYMQAADKSVKMKMNLRTSVLKFITQSASPCELGCRRAEVDSETSVQVPFCHLLSLGS